jgi:hypothetical protein
MISYLSYLDYVVENKPSDGTAEKLRLSKEQSTTYVVETKDGISIFPNSLASMPSRIEISDYSYYGEMPDRIILQTLWIPMLILGSYILVHSDLNVLVKQRK